MAHPKQQAPVAMSRRARRTARVVGLPFSGSMGWALYLVAVAFWLLTCDVVPASDQPHGEGHTHATLLQALHGSLAHLLVLGTILLAATVWSLRPGFSGTRRLCMVRQQAPAKLLEAAEGLIPSNRLYLLADSRAFAACIGLWRPGIYVSRGLLETLVDAPLRGMLAHEEAHRRRRDPLRLLVWRALARRLRRIPWATSMAARAELRIEIVADRFACAATTPAQLAAALLMVLDARAKAGGLGVGGDEGLALFVESTYKTPHRSVADLVGERFRYLALPADAPLPPLISARMWDRAMILALLLGTWRAAVPGVSHATRYLALNAPFLPAVPVFLQCLIHS